MSCSDWLYRAAVGGWLIAAAVLIWSNNSYAVGQPNETQEHRYAGSQHYASVRPPIEGIAKFGGPDDYNSPCQESQGGPYTDLCQQWRMAKAAENQADWSRIQIILSAIGICGLIATIIYTHLTFRLTAHTTQRQLRAYLLGSACDIEEVEGGYLLTVVLKNTGQTPAFNVRLSGESFAGDYPLTNRRPHPEPINGDGFRTAVGAGCELMAAYRLLGDDPAAAMEAIKAGKLGFWIHGTVFYDDCFGKAHKTKFRHVFGGRVAKSGLMALHADREGNEAD